MPMDAFHLTAPRAPRHSARLALSPFIITEGETSSPKAELACDKLKKQGDEEKRNDDLADSLGFGGPTLADSPGGNGFGREGPNAHRRSLRKSPWSTRRDWDRYPPLRRADFRGVRLAQFLSDFEYSSDYMKWLAVKVKDEIDKSYRAHAADPLAAYHPEKSDFRSLDTCVKRVPDGKESGVYYGIDVGGTNMRVVRCQMHGGGNSQIDAEKYNIASHRVVDKLEVPLLKGLMDAQCGASFLFDYIADAVKKMLTRFGDDQVSIGFTFSFAIQMKRINEAIVINTGKGFETGSETDDPLIGEDCVAMMNAALKRKQVKALIAGCLNDTTGTLLTAAYEAGKNPDLPPVEMGMIIGTGFNTAVADEKALAHKYQGSLINLESGGLKCRDHLVDRLLDYESSNFGEQRGEKKISGAYLAEVARRSYVWVLQSEAPPKMFLKGSIQTSDIAEIFNSYVYNPRTTQDTEKCQKVTQKAMKKHFEWDATPAHCQLIAEITNAVWSRSAAIVAAIIAGCAEKAGRLGAPGDPRSGGLTVGVDGSVYCLNPLYQKLIRAHLETILGPKHELVHIIETKDGSGKGAAMLACANPVDFSQLK